eukprot:COSAG01_NODE_9227_length_2512_cov_36.151678_3_plen_89_part_00
MFLARVLALVARRLCWTLTPSLADLSTGGWWCVQVLYGHSDVRLTRIAFFAGEDVPPGRELTFDYGETTAGAAKKCECGAPNCRGSLQ